jgi:threonyl-tRNA synthetase
MEPSDKIGIQEKWFFIIIMSKILDEKIQNMSAQDIEMLKLRHTAEHVLHTAMQTLYPQMKKAMGPATNEEFYFDFDLDEKISENNFPAIEKEMKKLTSSNLKMVQEKISIDEAIKIFKDNPYKIEWINAIAKRDEEISIFKMVNHSGDIIDLDLCSGPHASYTSKIKAFTLLSVAGAYWHGNEKNKMLTRIYGTCFSTKAELDQYLWAREEAKKRVHKKLGKELDLYIIPEELGPGLLIWTPKGATLRREMERFIIDEQIKRGYQHVNSPHIGKKSLWQTSGHWDLYRDKMYRPIKIDNDEYLVKPMNCPMHMMVYKSHPRSYRDLPIRIAENATVYRYEQAGELSGMTRVRYITQDDSHIFCQNDQVIDEFLEVLDYIIFLLKAFQINNYSFRLSLRDPKNKDKYLGDDAIWEKAEEEIETAVKKVKIKYEKKEGEAAFYGPKLDVMIKDALGREWQCGTIQIDFMLPQRFKLEYINEKGELLQPALIHRAPLGSLERFTGILIEHFAGKFPLWLSPIQLIIIPIADRHLEYASKVTKFFLEKNIRVELKDKNESMQSKIRDATLQKVPYMGIIGDKELSLGKSDEKKLFLSLRNREGKDFGQMEIPKVLERLQTEIEKKF